MKNSGRENDMSDYIKREDAIRLAKDIVLPSGSIIGYHATKPIVIWRCIDADEVMELPSADVVEVVRCKDCKHYRIWEMKCDRLHVKPFADNHYCSFGERAEA